MLRRRVVAVPCRPWVFGTVRFASSLDRERFVEKAIAALKGTMPLPFDVSAVECEQPRTAAASCFAEYVKEVASLKPPRAPHIDLRTAQLLDKDELRVPIAANCGTPGSGKTRLLNMCCRRFQARDETRLHAELGLEPRALYVTCNGDSADFQPHDVLQETRIRVATRLLHNANSVGLRLIDVRETLKVATGVIDDQEFDKTIGDPLTLNAILRGAMGDDEGSALLVAFDEVRKLDASSQAGVGVSQIAVRALKFLSQLSQKTVASWLRGGVPPTFDPRGGSAAARRGGASGRRGPQRAAGS